MRHGSLFSGIGGFDLAAEWMGWENVFHCEWNDFGQKVLKYYWPNAISYGDINKTDFTIHRGGIDILTGGFPCQPFSQAGKRKGTEDDRHLWPRMLEVIKQIQPIWVVGENVYGLVNWDGGMVFDQVQSDLESAGYEVQPVILPAASVNAPHRRDRVWFIAHNNSIGQQRYAEQNGDGQNRTDKDKRFSICQKQGRDDVRSINARGGKIGTTPDTNGRRQPSKEYRQKKSDGITENGIPGDWQDFPTQSPICDRNDGLSTRLSGITFSKWRNESIKAMGNAIVPQVVFQIFKTINEK